MADPPGGNSSGGAGGSRSELPQPDLQRVDLTQGGGVLLQWPYMAPKVPELDEREPIKVQLERDFPGMAFQCPFDDIFTPYESDFLASEFR
jgi:hypothetical protein